MVRAEDADGLVRVGVQVGREGAPAVEEARRGASGENAVAAQSGEAGEVGVDGREDRRRAPSPSKKEPAIASTTDSIPNSKTPSPKLVVLDE